MLDQIPFQISPGSTEPIHKQLVEQFRRRIASGLMRAGDELPSVRELAQTLAINPMTVSKAYGLMEQEGLVTRRRGLPMIVARLHAQAQTDLDRLNLLRPTLERAATEANQLGLEPDLVIRYFQTLIAKP